MCQASLCHQGHILFQMCEGMKKKIKETRTLYSKFEIL